MQPSPGPNRHWPIVAGHGVERTELSHLVARLDEVRVADFHRRGDRDHVALVLVGVRLPDVAKECHSSS